MHMLRKSTERGAVSMLTVIFLALLLTVITTSFVRLSITEQRQAVDDDLTTRAFYAAESGVEDAKRAIADFQSGQPINLNAAVCDPADVVASGVLSTDLAAEYTCQLIDMSPADFQADLSAWEAVTIPLRAAGTFNAVQIEWHIYNNGDPYGRRANSAQDLPTISSWTSSNYPAMLRAGVFSHPNAASFSSAAVTQGVSFINPAQTAQSIDVTGNDGQIRNGGCSGSPTSGSYACSATITGVNNARTYYLRLQSLYRGTNVKVTLLNSGSPVQLDDVQAVIDVTGRAGDVFRRVEARVSLLSQDYPLPDIALWSNTEICKNFTVTDDVSEYVNTCPWAP